jgi:hypothetical protein
MNCLYEPEVIPAINGKGWTIVRVGRDDKGAYQDWIGENYESYEDALNASTGWEEKIPSFGITK